MKIEFFKMCRSVLATSLLALACLGAMAQTSAAQTAATQTAAAVQTPSVPARVTQIVDEGNLTTLRGNVHRLARPEFDRGPVADSQIANRMVLLLKRSQDQETALRQLLDAQQDKSSKSYRAWLTPDQFGKQFGPADADILAVTDWLTARGFTGIKVGAGRTTIEFSGNVGQVRNAFHTEIHHFFVNGKTHMANVSDPQIPAALAPVVAGVLSLHDFRPRSQAHRLGTFRKTKATGEVKPLFTFTGCGQNGTNPCYAVGPGDFSKIYNVAPSGMDGTGVTIAIVQDSNLNVADVQAYRSIFGLSNNFTTSNIILNGPDPGIQGPNSATDDELEADLDAELAGGVAPGATIDVVVSEDSQSIGVAGIDLSATYIIDNNIAAVMSESFGACETGANGTGAGGDQFYSSLWEQASAQGITVILPSGDSGSDSCDQGSDFGTSGLSVSGLASSPFNVAVGGTDFQNGANPSPFWNAAGTPTISAKSYIPESTWNNSCAAMAAVGSLAPCTATIINGDLGTGTDTAAGGGGPSAFNAKPTWQMGTLGNPVDGFRDVPDISLFAGNGANGSFYIVCNMDSNSGTGSSTSSCDLNSPFNDFQGVGGTSAGAPAFAGIMALVNQKTGKRQGNPNYVLYQLYKKNTAGTICPSNVASVTAAGCIFYDTVTGNNSVACQGGSPNCSNTTAGANQFGVLVVDPTKPTTTSPAWTTTANYDNATGLGSLNVTNLLNSWASATFSADTVAITSPASGSVNITHGTSVSFTVKVTSGSGTPTGSVTLVAQPLGSPQVTIGTFSAVNPTTLVSGSVTIPTTQLPGGTNYPVIASYGGDGTFAAGTSAPVNVTVGKEGSKTAVSAVTFDAQGIGIINPGPISLPYGSAYILRVDVEDSAGNQCSTVVVGCPTGTVALTNNGAALKDFSGSNSTTLSNVGFVEDQPVQLPVGANSLLATYAGDNSFMASTSAPEVVTITTAPTTIGVTPSPTTVVANQSVTLTATVGTQSSGVGPTGTVTFSVNGKALTPAVAVVPTAAATVKGITTPASATAAVPTSFSSTGAQTITATYTGDTNYAGSGPSAAATVTVTGVGSQVTTTTVTSSVMSVAAGGSVTLTATVVGTTLGGAGPTNAVQFLDGTTALGAAATCTATAGTTTTPGSCVAMLTTMALTTPGAHSITGHYNGDTTYAASTSAAITVTVTGGTKPMTTTVVTSSAASIASGGSVTLTATVTAAVMNVAAPGGTVQFMNGTTALGAAATCTAAASATTCTATLMTTLSLLAPPTGPPHRIPNVPLGPVWIVAGLMLILFLLSLKRLPMAKRIGYACAGILLFACVAAGIAGCGGSSSTPPPTSHIDSITAVYSGDANYSTSTSTAVPITIQ